jgi:integrase
MRCRGQHVRLEYSTKVRKAAIARRYPTGLGIAEPFQVQILEAGAFETLRQGYLREPRLAGEMRGGGYAEPTKTTLGQFLEEWLAQTRSQVTPRTHERYCEIVRKNIIPALGAVRLTALRPAQIAGAYAKALENGRRDGKSGLSPNTMLYMHRLIKGALAHAVKWGNLTKNPADAVDPPRVERPTLQTYDMAQTVDAIEAARGSRLFMAILLGVLCGLRRGEIVALRWRHVDLIGGSLAIVESAEQTAACIRYKKPKSGRARNIALSAYVMEELKAHKLRQAEELLRIGVRLNEAGFVYAREDGAPIQPRTLTHAWQAFVARAGLQRVRFHDLRHAHATHLLSSGVHPKVASERLGHSKVGITLDLYSHVLPGMQEMRQPALTTPSGQRY